MLQIFGTKKCKNTEKAVRFFKERKIEFHWVDLTEKKMSKGELENISKILRLEDMLDRTGKEYKKRNLEYMEYDLFEEILSNPLLLKTPIIRLKNKASAGYEPEIWKEWLK